MFRQRDFIEEILPGKYTVFNKFSAAILQEGVGIEFSSSRSPITALVIEGPTRFFQTVGHRFSPPEESIITPKARWNVDERSRACAAAANPARSPMTPPPKPLTRLLMQKRFSPERLLAFDTTQTILVPPGY